MAKKKKVKAEVKAEPEGLTSYGPSELMKKYDDLQERLKRQLKTRDALNRDLRICEVNIQRLQGASAQVRELYSELTSEELGE